MVINNNNNVLPGIRINHTHYEVYYEPKQFATLFLSFEIPASEEAFLLYSYSDIKNYKILDESLKEELTITQSIKVYFDNGGEKLYLIRQPDIDFKRIEEEDEKEHFKQYLSKKCDGLNDVETILAVDLVDKIDNQLINQETILIIQNLIADYAYNPDRVYTKNYIFLTDLPKVDDLEDYVNRLYKSVVFYPYLKTKDELFVPSSVYASALLSKQGYENKIHYPIANKTLKNVIDKKSNIDDEILYKNNINPIRFISNEGYKIWGTKTLNFENEELEYLNVLRVYFYIKRVFYSFSRIHIFEPNDDKLRYKITRKITQFLMDLWKIGALEGKTQSEAFYLICDESNNSAEDREDGKLVFDVFVSISKPLEYIHIHLNMLTDSHINI